MIHLSNQILLAGTLIKKVLCHIYEDFRLLFIKNVI